MLEVLTGNCLAKPRINPVPFIALKRNSCVKVMLLFLADCCSSALREFQKKEYEDMGHLTGNPLPPLSMALRTDKSTGVTSSYSSFRATYRLSIVVRPSHHLCTTKDCSMLYRCMFKIIVQSPPKKIKKNHVFSLVYNF